MPLMGFLALMMLLWAMTPAGQIQEIQHSASPGSSWRLVRSFRSGIEEKPQIVSYWIGVDRIPDEEGFKDLVCSVIQKQRPGDYDYLNVSVYYRIESESVLETTRAKAHLGGYTWNKEIPENRYRLSRYKDENGQVIPYEKRFSAFNHVVDCPPVRK